MKQNLVSRLGIGAVVGGMALGSAMAGDGPVGGGLYRGYRDLTVPQAPVNSGLKALAQSYYDNLSISAEKEELLKQMKKQQEGNLQRDNRNNGDTRKLHEVESKLYSVLEKAFHKWDDDLLKVFTKAKDYETRGEIEDYRACLIEMKDSADFIGNSMEDYLDKFTTLTTLEKEDFKQDLIK